MSWEKNTYKVDLIEKHGITYGLPLFEASPQPSPNGEGVLPEWIWDGKNISSEIFIKMEQKFKNDMREYLKVIINMGGAATDNEVKKKLGWESGRISARRNDAKKIGLITSREGAKRKGPTGQLNTIWFVNFNLLKHLLHN